jgi:hypothetical protein
MLLSAAVVMLLQPQAPLADYYSRVLFQADSGAYYDFGETYQPVDQIGILPISGMQNTVAAGESIVSRFNERLAQSAVVESDITPPRQTRNQATLKAGTRLYRKLSKAAYKGCEIDVAPGQERRCLLDDDGDGKFDRIASNDVVQAYPIEPADYSPKGLAHLPPPTSGFRREIIYQGMAAGSLKLSYREFKNDMARPAFSEDIQIPLSPVFPQQFAVKGLVFTAVAIDGMGFKYTLDQANPAQGW